MIDGLADRSFLLGAAISLQRVLIGYAISLFFGVLLGILIGRFRVLDETLGSFIVGLQALPSICWLPLAILWFGLSEAAILFVVIMGAILSITISTDDGIKNIPPILVRAARTMGTKGFDLYLRVILPAALPSIVTGMKMGWSFAWRSLMAGELLFVGLGLGHLLVIGRELADMNLVVAVMLVIVTIGVMVDRLVFARLEDFVMERWGLKGSSLET